jgi:cell division protein FtsW
VAARSQTPSPREPAGGVRPENILIVTVMALVCFGVVMVYSTSSATALLTQGDPTEQVTRQILYALLGAGAYLVFTRMSPSGLRRLGPLLIVVSGALLLAVLIPGIGTSVNGSRRWIALGPLGNIQPSELAKLALVLWVAHMVAARPGMVREARGLVPFFAVFAVLGVLIMIEPDMDGAVVLGVLLMAMLAVAGAHLRHLAAVVAAAALPLFLLVMAAPYRRERLMAFFDPSASAGDAGYQGLQAQIAVGVGGISGVGLGDGVQKAFYLPEASTDMILATVGEELGLIGVVALIAGFALFAYAGFRIALGARDLHQQVVAAGITVMVVMQAVINMGAVLGIIPVAGLTLPFVSFGGSSLIILLSCTGILVNIGRRSTAYATSARVVPVDDRRDRGGRDRGARHARSGGRRSAAGARG